MALELLGQERYTITDWQEEDIDFLLDRDWSANFSEMGSISGDARVTIQSSIRTTLQLSLRDAYHRFNRLLPNGKPNPMGRPRTHPWQTLALIDGRIRHEEILAINPCGVKPTLRLTLLDGKTIDLTPDHEVLTDSDVWVAAENISVGDHIIVKGGKGAKHDSKRTGYTYSYFKKPHELGMEVEVNGSTYWKVADHRLAAGAAKGQHVHHIDGTSRNNEAGNLSLMTLEEHSREHARDQIGSYDAPPMTVIKIEEGPTIDCYDIVIGPPGYNFVANGIVVHNCYKTTTGLAYIERKLEALTIEAPRVLIISTRGGKGTFYDAIPKTMVDPSWRVYDISARKVEQVFPEGLRLDVDFDDYELAQETADRPVITLAHYHCFMNKSPMNALLHRYDWDFIWCDEAHRMKDKDTQWTRQIKSLKCSTGLRHVSTGTGFINNPAELYSLLNFLNRRTFSSYWGFRRKYCEEMEIGGFNRIIGIKEENAQEFIDLRKSLGPRRMMRNVHADISEPIFSPRTVDLNPVQRRMYNGIKSELRALDQNGYALHSPNVLSMLNRLRQICVATPEVISDEYDPIQDRRVQKIKLTEPSSKLDEAMEIIESAEWSIENKAQVVVFSNFKGPLDLLQARLDKVGIPWLHLKESDNDADRYRKWHDIFPQKQHKVFMSTLQLGGESINLTSAQYCIFLDRSWSPKDNNQGVSRIYRPGQTGVPEIFHINASKTTDQRMEATHNLKTGWFNRIFNDEDE